MIKELWLSDVDWDDGAPDHISTRFSAFMKEFPLLNDLHIPRNIVVQLDRVVRLVAFCDASMNGYGCVIYAHCTGDSRWTPMREVQGVTHKDLDSRSIRIMCGSSDGEIGEGR